MYKKKLYYIRLLNGIRNKQDKDKTLKIIFDCIKAKDLNELMNYYLAFDDEFIEQFNVDGNEVGTNIINYLHRLLI